MDRREAYLSLDQCKDGYLYRIHSRNLAFGVYNNKTKGFSGIRTKFGYRYIFEEYHWDTGAPFGTVHPIEEVCMCPIDISSITLDNESTLMTWLEEQEKIFASK